MAIVRDAVSNGGGDTDTSITVSHVCTGGKLILFSLIILVSDTADKITSVTYNSVAMSLINSVTSSHRTSLYYLLLPANGTHDVVVSLSSGVAGGTYVRNASYTGVEQVAPTIQTTSTAASTTCANTLTSTVNNSIHVAGFTGNASYPASCTNGTLVEGQQLAESNPLLITPAAAHTMTGNFDPSQNIQTNGVIVAPFIAVTTTNYLKSYRNDRLSFGTP